jgi:hypothetical protein
MLINKVAVNMPVNCFMFRNLLFPGRILWADFRATHYNCCGIVA